MAGSEGSGKKWLTCGCLGCLAVIAIVLLGLAAVFGTAWVGVQNEQLTERSLKPATGHTSLADDGRPGRVVLRLSGGEFVVRAAEPGEAMRVEATYDEKNFELTESFEPGEDHWTYELGFDGHGSMLMRLLKSIVGGTESRVEVFLPPDVPLRLEVDIRQGGSQMDLGGLWLTAAEIEFNQGGFELDVSEPLREPMESLSIHGAMGGFQTERLGHASPRRLDVRLNMGGMNLDLRGDWAVDSEITIRSRQGGAAVRLPRDVNIVGIEAGRMIPPAEGELPRPTLTFSVSSEGGEIDFIE